MADTKTKPLDRLETNKVLDLKDDICQLILINGWRRNELAQVIQTYDYGDYAYFKPKKHNEIMRFSLTDREKELLKNIVIIYKQNKTLSAINKKLNRHFESLSNILGFRLFPHRLRATMATDMNDLGVSGKTIQNLMNHRKFDTTMKYIQPSQEALIQAKENRAELITVEGMTIYEWKKLVLEKNRQIKRLEREVQKWKILAK